MTVAYKKISGVYKILCSGNGKVYIGSAVSIKQRWACHKGMLKNGKHGNKHLQNSFAKYGSESFEFSIVEECSNETLILREQYWIDTYDAANPNVGLNNSPTASTTVGFKHSAATKARLSELASARDHSRLLENAKNMRGKPAHNKGIPGQKWSDERKREASISRKGRVAWNAGIPMAEEVKVRVSNTLSIVKTKYGSDIADRICALRSDGLTWSKISGITGVSLSQCSKIHKGQRRYDSLEKFKGVAK